MSLPQLCRKVKTRYLQATTTPLPSSFPKTERGLMTLEEYLERQNPDNVRHDTGSYDLTLMEMAKPFATEIGRYRRRQEVIVEKYPAGYLLRTSENTPLGVIFDGTLYYSNAHVAKEIPKVVVSYRDYVDMPEINASKHVKYLSEYLPLIDPIAKRNTAEYPVVLQRLIIDGEPLTVRAEKPFSKLNQGIPLAILNSEGYIVATASDEWGATLLRVVQEYRGKGIGKILGKIWYDQNPSYTSGGYTDAGKQSAIAMWRDRVKEFLAYGWYTELVKQGRITYERVSQILKGIGETMPRPKNPPQVTGPQPTGDILVFSDDSTFVVYDRAFLETQDESFIHGYGFFRSSSGVGTFIYRIDYDRAFAELTTKVALQLAKDMGTPLYMGEGYHDLVEYESIPGVVLEGDYLKVTRNLLPVKSMVQREKSLRKAVDSFGEIHDLLLEISESKWS